jgi:hypothetical protein
MIGDEPRPALLSFAQAMEARLSAHDDRPGWQRESWDYLFLRLIEQTGKLARLRARDESPAAIARAAVDVGNFSMMLYDKIVHGADVIAEDPFNE